MSGAGIGHAIAFAYNSFDNPHDVRPMILLLRDCRQHQHAALDLGAQALCPARGR